MITKNEIFYINKIVAKNEYEDDAIILHDGTKIEFHHEQDCCEEVYADLEALKDTGFGTDWTITRETLNIEKVEGYGIKLNGYGIPCYNNQNGYYSSDLEIIVNDEPYMVVDCDYNGTNNYYD